MALNWSEEQCRSSKLRRILPTRRGKTGTRPGVRGTGPSGPTRGNQEQWKFRPDINLTGAEKKELIARVVEVAVAMLFQTHVYGFGGNYYRQTSGGPIGLRSTCAVARLVMKVCDDKWLARLEDLRVRIEEAIRYMDDGRTALHSFKHGWRWSLGKRRMQTSQDWKSPNLSRLEVTRE